jgi:hypothetical protein
MTKPWHPGGLTCAEADDMAPAFVLGALEPDEIAAVRDHLAECQEVHAAFGAFGGTAAYLAELPEPADPPAALKDRLMAAVADDHAAVPTPASAIAAGVSAAATTAATTDAAETTRPDDAPVSLDAERAGRRPILRWVLAAAAVLAIVALLGNNLLLQSRVDQSEELARLLRDAVVAAGQPDATVATVAGTEAQPNAGGFVVVPAEGAAYLVVDGLAALETGQVYEAWTIGPDEVPVPAGTATPTDGLVVMSMEPDAPVDIVALTIEPAGGSAAPTTPVQAAATLGG